MPGLAAFSTSKIVSTKPFDYVQFEEHSLRMFSLHLGLIANSMGETAIVGMGISSVWFATRDLLAMVAPYFHTVVSISSLQTRHFDELVPRVLSLKEYSGGQIGMLTSSKPMRRKVNPPISSPQGWLGCKSCSTDSATQMAPVGITAK